VNVALATIDREIEPLPVTEKLVTASI